MSDTPRTAASLREALAFFLEDDNYIDPGADTCNRLSYLDRGTIEYAYRRNYGNFCGSYADVGYGTLQNGREAANFWGSATYRLSDSASLFLDIQAGTSHQDSYNTPLEWQNSYQLNGDSTPIPFYNAATGQIEQWQRVSREWSSFARRW